MAAMHASLALSSAVPAGEVAGTLPDTAGLYAIWGEVEARSNPGIRLLYIGKTGDTVGVRRRVLGHLHMPGGKSRPNETLPILLLDQIIRPDMRSDDRTCMTIAVDYLRRCVFAGWAWDGSATLSECESRAIARGIQDQLPLCNWPRRRER
jgi:hypothetical protein